ncbi:MAG TPA: MEDS domain-containing protein [Rickettsiales bacterium]|nr:MEDS domain-containing protein [Rickettsiales bacterium]
MYYSISSVIFHMDALPRHQCIVYGGQPTLHLQSLALTIIGKLKGKKRCLYLNSPAMVAEMRTALITAGLDPAAEIKKGSLVFVSDQNHLVDGKFDVDKMMDMLNITLQQALADGYTGLWATGDMTWEFGSEKNFAKLFEYEQRLDIFMKHNPGLSGVCQYHRDNIPIEAIETAGRVHPAMYVSDTLSHINPDYELPAA